MARSSIRGLIAFVLATAVGACQASSWVVLGGKRFDVEVAVTPQEQARGLMFREELPADHGMLFIYERAAPRSFWMKNTLIPLDILFFDGRRRLINWHTAQPCRAEPCPAFAADEPARYVLELNAGMARSLGLAPGAELEMHIEP